MRKNLLLFCALATSAMIGSLTAACDPKNGNENENENQTEATLTVGPDTDPIEFSAAATESFTFTVDTDQPSWDADSNREWCVVTVAEDGKSFTVTALPNTLTTAPEAAVITVTAGEATPVEIDAAQAAAEEPEPEPTPAHISFKTAYMDEGGMYAPLIAGSGEATIDWGDGTPLQTVTLNPLVADYYGDELPTSDNQIEHVYAPGTGEKTIVITGDGVTGLGTGFTGWITEMTVEMPSLKYLDCKMEAIESLDLTACPELKMLFCESNLISDLDVDACTHLTWLVCTNNALTSLDVTGKPDLFVVACDDNYLDAAALLQIFNDLPDRTGGSLPEGELYCGGYNRPNPGYAEVVEQGYTICGAKNWWPYPGRS
ncbi:MAG: hypothetical protein LBV18_03835 [Alistipes sp.]|jgi:Leucine-rich repeat (LRR) protein|nr:hypothetical protein [Alistipes sp.]